MRVGIHQPNYFPYQGYFYKITHCDMFVFMDNVQFPQGGNFCYRNRIKTSNGAIWISVPTRRGERGITISEVRIDNDQNWSEKHLRTLYHAYSKAPYFRSIFSLFEEALSRSWEYLAELNMHLIKVACHYMGIEESCRFVCMKDLYTHGKGTDLLIDVCKRLGADTYVSGVTGKKYMESKKFERAGVRLAYCIFEQPEYPQLWSEEFIPNLSVLDILFNCGPSSRKILLSNFPLVVEQPLE